MRCLRMREKAKLRDFSKLRIKLINMNRNSSKKTTEYLNN